MENASKRFNTVCSTKISQRQDFVIYRHVLLLCSDVRTPRNQIHFVTLGLFHRFLTKKNFEKLKSVVGVQFTSSRRTKPADRQITFDENLRKFFGACWTRGKKAFKSGVDLRFAAVDNIIQLEARAERSTLETEAQNSALDRFNCCEKIVHFWQTRNF